MKSHMTALIFGYTKYGIEIANSVSKDYRIKFYTLESELSYDEEFGYDIEPFDLSDDWIDLDQEINIKTSIVFCVLDDEAENIFLTISLRAHFKELVIVAIAKNKESAHKLKMAGANKVIPIEETTAEIISDMIHKPIFNQVLNDILYSESDLKIAQIEVENVEIFDDEYLMDIDWTRYKGIMVLSIMHPDFTAEYIYSSKSKRTKLQNGDMIIVVGYEADIAEFEKIVGSRKYVNWSDWSRKMG